MTFNIKSFTSILFNKKIVTAIYILVLIAAISVGGFFYYQYQKTQDLVTNPNRANEQEIKEVIKKVSALIVLPEGEEPVFATVSDKEKLASQPFFNNSENGDKVLVYNVARKAFLYRPSVNKLIEVSYLNDNTFKEESKAATEEKKPEIKIGLRNGTTVVGLTRTIEPDIIKAVPELTVIKRENASKQDYARTIVVIQNEKYNEQAAKIAEVLAGDVAVLPEGEVEDKALDILVIVGISSQ